MATLGYILAFILAIFIPRAMFALVVGILSHWNFCGIAFITLIGLLMDAASYNES